MPSTKPSSKPAIACSLSQAELGQRMDSLSWLTGEALSVSELDDGLELTFPPSDETATRLLEAIVGERRCCPFFRFELVFEPHEGPVRLRLRGPREARKLLRLLLAERGETR